MKFHIQDETMTDHKHDDPGGCFMAVAMVLCIVMLAFMIHDTRDWVQRLQNRLDAIEHVQPANPK